MTITPTTHAVRVRATRSVTVTYWPDLNMVEVSKSGQVVRSEVAPSGYTARQFAETVNRVKLWYATHDN